MHIQFSKVVYALACVGAVSCAPLLGENNLNARAPVPAATSGALVLPTGVPIVKPHPNLINISPDVIAGLKPNIITGGGSETNPVASDREYGYGPIHFGYPKDEALSETINVHPELADALGVKVPVAGVNVAGLTPREEGEKQS